MLFGLLFLLPKEQYKSISPSTSQTLQEEKITEGSPIDARETYNINKNTATLKIEETTYEAVIEKNTSVYDFMDKLRTDGKINFKEKTYLGLGKFIEEIDGIRGDGTRFWIYYVNGQKAKIGVSNYKINPGDIVSWKYEKESY